MFADRTFTDLRSKRDVLVGWSWGSLLWWHLDWLDRVVVRNVRSWLRNNWWSIFDAESLCRKSWCQAKSRLSVCKLTKLLPVFAVLLITIKYRQLTASGYPCLSPSCLMLRDGFTISVGWWEVYLSEQSACTAYNYLFRNVFNHHRKCICGYHWYGRYGSHVCQKDQWGRMEVGHLLAETLADFLQFSQKVREYSLTFIPFPWWLECIWLEHGPEDIVSPFWCYLLSTGLSLMWTPRYLKFLLSENSQSNIIRYFVG